MDARTLSEIGMILVFVGFAIAFVSTFVLMFSRAKGGSRVRGGGVIMLGPFPIIFGTDKGSVKTLILLSLVLMIVVLAFMWLTPLGTR